VQRELFLPTRPILSDSLLSSEEADLIGSRNIRGRLRGRSLSGDRGMANRFAFRHSISATPRNRGVRHSVRAVSLKMALGAARFSPLCFAGPSAGGKGRRHKPLFACDAVLTLTLIRAARQDFTATTAPSRSPVTLKVGGAAARDIGWDLSVRAVLRGAGQGTSAASRHCGRGSSCQKNPQRHFSFRARKRLTAGGPPAQAAWRHRSSMAAGIHRGYQGCYAA